MGTEEVTYRPYKMFAETLEELADRCGEHGEAAVCIARWGAVIGWLMNTLDLSRSASSDRFNDAQLSRAVALMKTHDMARLGYPAVSGKHIVSPLDDMPIAERDAVVMAGAQMLSDWERAGEPYMTRDRIKNTHMYVRACVRNAEERAVADAALRPVKAPQDSATGSGLPI